MNQLTVIIPVYNEYLSLERSFPDIISYCLNRQWDIIIVNDGSTDGSRELLNQFSKNDQITILHHKLNKGYGAALKTGFIACHTAYSITFDADGQHAHEDIDKLFHIITSRDADLVVGSRRSAKTTSYYRGIGKGFIRYLAKILMTVPIYDLNSGMKIYRTELAQRYLGLLPDTMAFSDIITLVFLNNRHLVLEEPIQVRPRIHGKSAIGIQTAFQTIMEVIHIVILFNPMKVFLPLSLLCFLFALIWGLPLIFMGRGISVASMLGLVTGVLLFLLGLITEQLSLIRRNQNK